MPGPALRLGLIGAGRWGRNIIRTVPDCPDLALAAVASRNPETSALVPDGCRIAGDWRALLEADDIDALAVAAPPSLHAEIIAAAIEAGRPVFVEKPMVRSAAEAARIRSLLQARPATVTVDHIHLFHPAFRALQREAARLGPVRSIAASAGARGPVRPDLPVLWDWGPHDIAMCLAFVPGPVGAMRGRLVASEPRDGGRAETVEIGLELAGGVPAQIRISNREHRHRYFAAAFDACTLAYRDGEAAALVRLQPGERPDAGGVPLPHADGRPLTLALSEFAAAARRGDRDPASATLGLDVVEIIARIEAAMER